MEREPWYKRTSTFLAGLAGLLLAVVSLIQAVDVFQTAAQEFLARMRGEPAKHESATERRTEPVPENCQGVTPGEWRARYIRPALDGTFHVFAVSLKNTKDKAPAEAEAARLRAQFRSVDFEPMFTQGTSDIWAVVLAQGLSDTGRRFI